MNSKDRKKLERKERHEMDALSKAVYLMPRDKVRLAELKNKYPAK